MKLINLTKRQETQVAEALEIIGGKVNCDKLTIKYAYNLGSNSAEYHKYDRISEIENLVRIREIATVKIIIHEIGHYFAHVNNIDVEDIDYSLDIFMVHEYNWRPEKTEKFAEAFAIYFFDPQYLQQMSKALYSYFESLFE